MTCRTARNATLSGMSNADIAEILKLPAEARLRIVELIWESLAATPGSVPLSDAHRTALDAELAEHNRNPADVVALDDVMADVRRRR